MAVLENAEEWEDDEKQPDPGPDEILRIPGSIVSFVERLDDELTRSLQHIDPHTVEYIDRLVDEKALYTSIVKGMLYMETLAKNAQLGVSKENLNRVVMRRLEHVYFKVGEGVVPCLRQESDFDGRPIAISSCQHPRRAHLDFRLE